MMSIVLVAGGLVTACADREHMSDNFGRQTRTVFARQHVSPQAAEGSPGGLDSEEAALIQGTYEDSLGGQAKRSEPDAASRVLLLRESPNAPAKP